MATTSDRPVLELLAEMTADSLDYSGLDSRTLMFCRLAALIAVDAPAASYLLNLGAASELDFELDDIRGVLTAVAPIVGTTHVVSATGNVARALGFAIEAVEGASELDD